jgi:hypothetical protein
MVVQQRHKLHGVGKLEWNAEDQWNPDAHAGLGGYLHLLADLLQRYRQFDAGHGDADCDRCGGGPPGSDPHIGRQVDHCRYIDDAHMVVQQRHELHGIGKLEWNAEDQRNPDAHAGLGGYLYLLADLLQRYRQFDGGHGDADRDRRGSRGPYAHIRRHLGRFRYIDDDHMVIQQRDGLHGIGKLDWAGGGQRNPDAYADLAR